MIHSYKLGGLNIVLDIFSGSVHVVDDVAYDIIGLYESHSRDEIVSEILAKYRGRDDVTREEILDCCDSIEELRKAGKLFTPDTFSDKADKLKERPRE